MSAINQIVVKLHEYFEARDAAKVAEAKAKALHQELMIMAVECGMDQADAISGGAKYWLDGYLVASGHIPPDRS